MQAKGKLLSDRSADADEGEIVQVFAEARAGPNAAVFDGTRAC